MRPINLPPLRTPGDCRALQGGFAAMLAPAALSLISVTFHEPKERAKAFGVIGAISGGGAAVLLVVAALVVLALIRIGPSAAAEDHDAPTPVHFG